MSRLRFPVPSEFFFFRTDRVIGEWKGKCKIFCLRSSSEVRLSKFLEERTLQD